MADKSNRKPDVLKDATAYAELIKVYDAWLSYLLCRLGLCEVRVGIGEITDRLNGANISAYREGEEYVIRVDAKEVTNDGEDVQKP